MTMVSQRYSNSDKVTLGTRQRPTLLFHLVSYLSLSLSLSLVLHAQEPNLGTEAQREAGKKLYDQKCAQCHGYEGDANSVAKPVFRPQPRDFTSASFKFRTTGSGELPTHEDIKKGIREGMPYTGMPAWPKLSDEELSNLAYYIKTFSEDFKDYGDGEPLQFPKAPSFSEESAKRGRIVYEENQCLDCHGNLGRGDGKSVLTLKDQWEEPIRAADLTKRWTFRNGLTREDIYRTFTTGLDGSPMPSYDIQPPEDQWALVDYVYSLGKSDEPNYATVVVAQGIAGEIDIGEGKSLFQDAEGAYFPVIGQVIEPGRAFYPGVNGVEVKAVYNQDDIAIMLTWNDMTAETSGQNGPDLEVPRFDPEADSTGEQFSDAVAIQTPSKMPMRSVKPYFMFGDAKNPVDIWFLDLARNEEELFLGKGSQNLEKSDGDISVTSNYEDGQWTVIFKRKRVQEDGLSFEQGDFVPIAFSVWDGFNEERGNKRGITSWYHLYLEPIEAESIAGPMAKYGMVMLILELGLIFLVRRKYKGQA